MKVLQLNPICGVGSTGRIVSGIQEAILANGDDCLVVYNREPSKSVGKKIRIGSKWTIYRHALYTRLTDRQGFASKRETKQLIQLIDEYQPDVIHLHLLHGNYIYMPLLFQAINERKLPVVWTFHDAWALTGHCVHFYNVGCDRYQTGCHHCPLRTHHPASWIVDQSQRNWREKKELFNSVENLTIVTPSNWLADMVRNSYLKEKSIHVIPNGIDTKVFYPRKKQFLRDEYHIGTKFLILGCAGCWAPTKGLEDFKWLAKKIDRTKIQIVLIGLTKEQVETLPDGMIGIEKMADIERLAQWYSEADVFVNPTYEDNFPTTNLEALACGTPVITYQTGGSPESITETCGRIVKQGNKEALLQAILEEKDYPKNTVDCCQQGKRYDLSEVYKQYIDLYDKMFSRVPVKRNIHNI